MYVFKIFYMSDNIPSSKNNGEFYIGWMGAAPKTFAAFIKKYILILLPVAVGLGVLLAISQKKFGTGNFEFGTLTQVKGVYYNMPVPNIKVSAGKDILGNSSYITIPLVGYGKFGASGIIKEIEKKKNISLDGKQIMLKGTLLYNDGKIIMQVDGNDNPVANIANNNNLRVINTTNLGNITVRGEIIDPKCYFGVMKPGEGKPHRDCAIRCILGGISPMLHVMNEKGESNYYLIVGTNGEKMNETVQDFVAEPVEIEAKAVKYNDWVVLYVDGKTNLLPVSRSAFFQPQGQTIACVTCKLTLK